MFKTQEKVGQSIHKNTTLFQGLRITRKVKREMSNSTNQELEKCVYCIGKYYVNDWAQCRTYKDTK